VAADEESLFAVREVTKQYERTPDVDEQLRLCTPQAMLRDLHRPTTHFTVSLMDFQRFELALDGGRGAMASTKGVLQKSYRVPIVELVPTHAMFKQAWAELRDVLTRPWVDAPKFGTQYEPEWKNRSLVW
jgi:hypothetical protein